MEEEIYPKYKLIQTNSSIELRTKIRKKFNKSYYLTRLIMQFPYKGEESKINALNQFNLEAYKWLMCSKFTKAVADNPHIQIYEKDSNQLSEKERIINYF